MKKLIWGVALAGLAFGFMLVGALVLPERLPLMRDHLAEKYLYQRTIQGEDFEFLVIQLEDAIAARNYTIVNTAHVGNAVEKRGYQLGRMLVIEFCNLEMAARILQKDRRILSMMPCRIALYEEGDAVKVVAMRPIIMSRIFKDDPEIRNLAETVETDMIGMIDSLADN